MAWSVKWQIVSKWACLLLQACVTFLVVNVWIACGLRAFLFPLLLNIKLTVWLIWNLRDKRFSQIKQRYCEILLCECKRWKKSNIKTDIQKNIWISIYPLYTQAMIMQISSASFSYFQLLQEWFLKRRTILDFFIKII